MARVLVILLVLAMLAGCQTPLASSFRDDVMPDEPALKVASFPLLFPAYIVITFVDLTMVNPVRGATNVPDVTGRLWSWHNEENPWVGYGALMPVKLIAIPIVAVGTTMFSEQFDYDVKREEPSGPAASGSTSSGPSR